mmetsp:Transcript_27048/g.71237  ORF Transcript_27048/g.71237 Transcript_27048/m.71237 type:complete len:87 (-) Transcript_27048:1886-2146(-)
MVNLPTGNSTLTWRRIFVYESPCDTGSTSLGSEERSPFTLSNKVDAVRFNSFFSVSLAYFHRQNLGAECCESKSLPSPMRIPPGRF